MGVVGAMAGAAAFAGTAFADEAAPDIEGVVTAPEVEALGGSTMSIHELNRRRHELVDSKGDFECSDGSTVPAVWNKLRTLVNTYGTGIGSDMSDKGPEAFAFWQRLFTEDEAQAYIEMPYGVMFSAAEFAAETGRDEAECEALCEDLAARNLLFRCRRAGVPFYHHIAVYHGMFEYNLNNYSEEGWLLDLNNMEGADGKAGFFNAGSPFYYAVPVNKDIVSGDDGVLPLTDIEKIVARNSVFAVSPCQCRGSALAREGIERPAIGSDELKDFMMPTCGHPLETCLSMGEEAEFYIENGIGRQIDQEEAMAVLQRSVDAGMILQSSFTNDSCVICSCTGECCGILKTYQAIGAEAFGAASARPNTSHYDLAYDQEACIKCGACIERCPMFAITFDDEGYPTVNDLCMRCGQCGLVCPAGARTLAAKAAEDRLETPADMLGDYNLKAAYRFEHGLLY